MHRLVAIVLWLGMSCALAQAADSVSPFDFRQLLVRDLQRQTYFGVGGAFVHHTGYVPGTRLAVESWRGGGKLFGGLLLTDQIRVEGAYHYLGTASFLAGLPLGGTETSHAFGLSGLVYTPELSRWGLPTFVPTRLFGRLGGVYKHISQRSMFGRSSEGGPSYVIGGGVEVDLIANLFVRFEYEYLGKIGTRRAINAQHTPLTLAVGGRF